MTDQLRIFAGLQGFLSAASLLALILYFTLGTPFETEQRRWAWLGPVNDWLYVLGAAPWIIASVLLVVRGRGGTLLWGLTVVLCVLVAAGATVTALMLAEKVGLNVQYLVTTPMTIVGFIWLWPAAAAAVGPPTRHSGWCSSSWAGFRSRSGWPHSPRGGSSSPRTCAEGPAGQESALQASGYPGALIEAGRGRASCATSRAPCPGVPRSRD